MAKLFHKVAIIGTGLIGGSLALAIKKNHLADQVVGVSRRKKNVLLARRIGAIDQGSVGLEIIRGSDAVVLATPVDVILKLAPAISRIVPRNCLVTDVGSTKFEVAQRLGRIFPNYIGSHPLAGSEKTGVIQAQPDLFERSLCLMTPLAGSRPAAIQKIKSLWIKVGARVIFLTPRRHDEILSFVSHLPHAVAFSLIHAIPEKHLRFAASGLKDTTRIAGSSSELWAQILLSNRSNLLKNIGVFQNSLARLRSALQRKDLDQLEKILSQAQRKREKLG